MKCQICESKNPSTTELCVSCGAPLGSAAASRIKRAIKVWLVGGLVGLGTALSWLIVYDALTTDLMFDLWELGVTLLTPTLIAVVISLATRSRIGISLVVAYLTILMPIFGAAFGGTGSEPIWVFAALGSVGGLVWSTPFALLTLLRKRK